MENTFNTFVDETLSPERAAILKNADSVLQNIGRREHQVGIENIISISDDADTVTTVQRIEDTLYYALTEAIGDYSIGASAPNFPILIKILTGMHDIIGYDDHQSLLDICDNDGTPEDKLCAILAEIYGDDIVDYLECINYVIPSLIIRIVDILSQRVDEVEEDIEEIEEDIRQGELVEAEESTASKLKRFVQQYRPEGFQLLIQNGYRLGYDIDTYLKHTLDPEIKDPDYLAREYLAAAIASGEDLGTARSLASDRLESRIDDLFVLQQAIRKMAGYQL